MGMTATHPDEFAEACAALVGQVAANPSLADAIILAIQAGELTPNSGPIGLSHVMKGAPGNHHLKKFLKAWQDHAPHLNSEDVTSTVMAALTSYRLAQGRAHTVDAVWTGPEVSGSEVRRTEAVVTEIIAGAESELLIVGYWLVTKTKQIRILIESLIKKARSGVEVRFVFDPGEKSGGPDNFLALSEQWPTELEGAERQVYTWSAHLTKATAQDGQQYDRKLHAKVVVADRRDALVTSANLTHAGLLENLEMGLRVQGAMAGAVVSHFDLLIDRGILERR
jgi:phosphatidylserine/phosphatidylglycerophosphate/cardiolipin synthase-like enzyme